jgi:hypothetical protein
MLLAAVGGEMTTLLLAIIGLIVVGLFSRAILVLATVCTLGFALFAALLVWQPRNDTPPLRPAAFKCPEGLWAKDPIVEIPSQMPFIEWAKKHCPGPIFTVPDKSG